ncbi:MAG: adenylyl-sulfate kinase [Planctomycetota bacterium]
MKGFTVWFTGLPCSGKTTLARRLEKALLEKGRVSSVLDGDEVRERICKGLGFSKEGRDENIRRISFVAREVTKTGGAAIACAISPYKALRAAARAEIGNFIEVFADCPVKVCATRDVKGMYKKAFAGEIKNFTGVDDPYEAPENPEVRVRTDQESEEACVEKILAKLRALGYLSA